VLEISERAARESFRRAARRLKALGLIDVASIRHSVLVPDPDKPPICRDGGLWVWERPLRLHVASRNAVWLTPFGSQVVAHYGEAIRSGRAIRWDPAVVRHCERTAEQPADPGVRAAAIQYQEDAWRSQARARQAEGSRLVPYVPHHVRTGDAERWQLAARLALIRDRGSRGRAVAATATEFYETHDIDALKGAIEAQEAGARPASRTDRFLRPPVPRLGVRVLGG
jgi:hypothetical protein